MQNESFSKAYFTILYLFLGVSLLILGFRWLLPVKWMDFGVFLLGNLLLFLVGCISVSMSIKALKHKNVQVFLRLVYSSFLIKFFILALGAFIYIAIYKKEINKPALFGCFGLYFIYTFIEVRSVMKLSKKPNA